MNLKLIAKDFSLEEFGNNKNKERAVKSSFRIIAGVVLNCFGTNSNKKFQIPLCTKTNFEMKFLLITV
ncbi:hypothetical protein ASE21_07605 [Flavobacterium sp. Root901]|nr:hypothetical protein ASE21_07605 [Flavobacterium sp. Root901]